MALNNDRRLQWLTLISYALVLFFSNILWLTFSALEETLTSPTGIYAGTDKLSYAVLTFSNPMTSIFVSAPAGVLADRRGFRFTVIIGALGETVFAFSRVFVWYDFTAQLILQFALSVSGLPVLASISKLSSQLFPKDKRGQANGVSTLFMLAGMSVGLFLSPLLYAAIGLQLLLLSYGLLMATSTVLFIAVTRRTQSLEVESSAGLPSKSKSSSQGVGSLLRVRELWILSFTMFAAYGITQVFIAYLPSMLASRQVSDIVHVGIVSSIMMTGGVFGSICLPLISDRVHRRKPFLMLSLLGGSALSFALVLFGDYQASVLIAAFLGFLLIPTLPLALTILPEIQSVGSKKVGTATGIVFLFGSIGAVTLGVLTDILKTPLGLVDPVTHQPLFDYGYSAILLTAIGFIVFAALLFLRESGKKESVHMM